MWPSDLLGNCRLQGSALARRVVVWVAATHDGTSLGGRDEPALSRNEADGRTLREGLGSVERDPPETMAVARWVGVFVARIWGQRAGLRKAEMVKWFSAADQTGQ
jgi:hypothetical protein